MGYPLGVMGIRLLALALLVLTPGLVSAPWDATGLGPGTCLFRGTAAAPCPRCVTAHRHEHAHAGAHEDASHGAPAPVSRDCSMRCAAAAQVLTPSSGEGPSRTDPARYARTESTPGLDAPAAAGESARGALLWGPRSRSLQRSPILRL